MSWNQRIILHADMDAFYAAVEQRDDPSLVGKPMVVGGDSKRGVVSTASYEARPYGIGSAMPMVEALRRCPDLVVVKPDFEKYQTASRAIMKVFADYSPLVEPLSLDEAFIDMSGAVGLFGEPREMGEAIKRDVRVATSGLTVSVGAATTKYVAKVASDYRKPDGLTIVPKEDVKAFLWPMPVSRLWGVGDKTVDKLIGAGFETIGDVARGSASALERRFGSLGPHIWNLANGIDPREVVPHRDPKSVGKEITLEDDITGSAPILAILGRLAEQVASRLRRKGIRAGGVRVKLKTDRFKLLTRQAPLSLPSDTARDLLLAARRLLSGFDLDQRFRLVGLASFNLEEGSEPVQTELFEDPTRARSRRLDRALDQVHAKFGEDSVVKGEGYRGSRGEEEP